LTKKIFDGIFLLILGEGNEDSEEDSKRDKDSKLRNSRRNGIKVTNF
jgi:hypothetical protein